MEQRRPQALKGIGDVGEAEAEQHERAEAHHAAGADHDAVEGGADAPHTEFIEGASLVEPLTQAGASLHEALQKGGDRHQAEPADQDQARQHHLAQRGELAAHIDDREPRHRDRRGHSEQCFPQTHAVA